MTLAANSGWVKVMAMVMTRERKSVAGEDIDGKRMTSGIAG